MTANKNPARDFCGSDERGIDKSTGEILPQTRKVLKFGMTANANEAPPGIYEAKCFKVDLDAHFMGAPKITLYFEILDSHGTGKHARMFFNNPGANTGEIGTGSKIYQTVQELYPEMFCDGEAEIDLANLFENKVFEIRVIDKDKINRKTKNKVGITLIVDQIRHPQLDW